MGHTKPTIQTSWLGPMLEMGRPKPMIEMGQPKLMTKMGRLAPTTNTNQPCR